MNISEVNNNASLSSFIEGWPTRFEQGLRGEEIHHRSLELELELGPVLLCPPDPSACDLRYVCEHREEQKWQGKETQE